MRIFVPCFLNNVMADKNDNNTEIKDAPKLWRLSLQNLNCFEEVWGIKLTVKRVAMIAVVVLFAAIVIGIAVVAFSPVKSLLPGFIKSDERESYENLSLKVDSLSTVAAIQNDYLENIVAIMSDSIETVIPEMRLDSVNVLTADSILPTSEAERKFVKQYEQRQKYNLSVLSPIAAEGMTFFVPVVGAKVQSETAANKGVTLVAALNAPVSSIYRGTVVAQYYVPNSGIAVIVQHPQDFLSVYIGLSAVYVSVGDKVNAGSRLGAMSSSRHLLTLELWRNGTALNPLEYIPF